MENNLFTEKITKYQLKKVEVCEKRVAAISTLLCSTDRISKFIDCTKYIYKFLFRVLKLIIITMLMFTGYLLDAT